MAVQPDAKEYPFAVGIKGINNARPIAHIADEELSDCINCWQTNAGVFQTRPGVTACLSNALPGPILALGYSTEEDKIIAVQGVNVYSMPSNFSTAPVLEGTTTGANTQIPVTFQNFAHKLFIASGGALQQFDNTGLSTVTAASGSMPVPQNAYCLAVKSNRLWVSEYGGSNLQFSGPEDPTDWGDAGSTPSLLGGSFSVEKDDGASISAMAHFFGNLHVHKSGHRNSIHKVIGSTSSTFEYEQVSIGTAALSPALIAPFDTDIFFCGQGGIYSTRLIDTIGNIQSVPISLKVNAHYIDVTPVFMIDYAEYGLVFVFTTTGYGFVYGRNQEAWYKWKYSGFNPTSAVIVDDVLYLGASDGMIYRVDMTSSDDNGTPFTSSFTTKAFLLGATIETNFIDKLMLATMFHTSGNVQVEAFGNYGQKRLRVRRYNGTGVGTYGFDGDLGFDMPGYGFDMAAEVRDIPIRIKRTANNIAFKVTTTASVSFFHAVMKGMKISRRGADMYGE